MIERVDARRSVLLWGLGLVLVAALVAGLVGALRKGTSELPVYTTAGARMIEGAEVYRQDDAKPFTYPPLFAAPFVPFTWLPESVHRGVWYFVNVGALAWIVVLLRRIARSAMPTGAREIWLWVLVAALAARHVAAVFQNQSHDLLVFGPIVLAVLAMRRGLDASAGLACGVAAACKATPLLFLPMFVGQLRVRATLFFVVAAVGATLLPDLLWPRADGGWWVVAWYETFLGAVQVGRPADGAGAWGASSFLNQNLAGTLYRLSVPVDPAAVNDFVRDVAVWHPSAAVLRGVTVAAQLLVVALIAVAAWPGRSRDLDAGVRGWRRVGEASLIVCGMLLLSPMSSKSHFCVLLLPAVYCLVDVLWRRRSVTTIAFLALSFAIGTLSTKGLLGRDFGNDVLAMGAVTWSAFAMMLATVSALVGARPASINRLADDAS